MRDFFFCSLLLSLLGLGGVASAQESGEVSRTDSAFTALHEALVHRADVLLRGQEAGGVLEAQPESYAENHAPQSAPLAGGTYDAILLPILRAHGLPEGLAAVVAVESGGNPRALSPKGARGLWQLMPETARRYGLTVGSLRDERLDPVRATDAAALYLRDLYAQFGSWPLALAAYNWGEANLAMAIRRERTTDLDALFRRGSLAAETHSYVPAVLRRWALRGADEPRVAAKPEHVSFASMTLF